MDVEESFDRPLECSECRKKVVVHYNEMVGSQHSRIGMCADCPVLAKKLYGGKALEQVTHKSAGLACGECGTNWEGLRISKRVGCSHCYQVFGDYLVSELATSGYVFPGFASDKRAAPLHIGRSPGEVQEMGPAVKLVALNDALEETLKKEDYEQAAWLRDQIKALTCPTGEEKSEE